MITKRIGDFPTNARIRILHNKGKPEIEFEYPDNKKQMDELHKSSGVYLISLGLIVVTFMFLIVIAFDVFNPEYPTCGITPIGDPILIQENTTLVGNLKNIIIVCRGDKQEFNSWTINWALNPITMKGTWWSSVSNEDSSTTFWAFINVTCIIIVYFGLFYIYRRVVAGVMKHTAWGRKHFPEINKSLRDKHYMAIFKEVPKNKVIELPLFSNIYMDYEAEDDFDKYLQEVEIKEHDFQIIKRKRGGKTIFEKLLSKKIEQYHPNVYLWKAVFKFSKRPKSGYIAIRWT